MMILDAAGAVLFTANEDEAARSGPTGFSETTELVLRARAGDIYAFELLMNRYQRQVLCTAARILNRYEDAKDASQEVFLKLYIYLGRIKPEALRSWLYKVTVTVCRDMVDKCGRASTDALEELAADREIPSTAALSADAAINLKERLEILLDALRLLPFRERAALVLRDIEGLSTEETARALGTTAGTVRSQISGARVKVRRYCERAMRRTT
jgi:RNA polymerase sigma-70 factor (ECF subfamily)